MTTKRNIITSLIISTILTLPLTGFLGGAIMCSDCGANVGSRIFLGIIWSFISVIGLGKVLADSPEIFDLRLWALLVFVLLFLALYYWNKRKTN
jgi:hypothetical protein